MTNAIVSSLFFVLLMSACAIAQAPDAASPVRDVDFCELDLHPKAYDGQFVRVRGKIDFEFESFTLWAHCTLGKAQYPASVWLMYGGDEPEAATYCCGGRGSAPGKDLEINGHKVGLVRDTEYYRLRSLLESGRLAHPDGTSCYYAAECKFYANVQATITGLFTAKPSEDSGYGHFGMYHLLAIQQVSDVSAERTAVPAGGQFHCDQQAWELECPNERECTVHNPSIFQKIVAHWKDSANPDEGSGRSFTEMDGSIVSNWASEDLLTGYSTKTKKAEQPPFTMTVTRQTCTQFSDRRGPAPSSAEVSCKSFSRSWREDKEAAKKWEAAFENEQRRENPTYNETWGIVAGASQKVFSIDQLTAKRSPDYVAWKSLGKQLRDWQLAIERDVKPQKCQEETVFTNVLLTDCEWISADGMSAYSVSLIKHQPEGSKGEVSRLSWRVFDISVRKCSAEP